VGKKTTILKISGTSMKITTVEHWAESFRLIKPYTIAYETYRDVKNHFVRIETEDGLIGIGAACPEKYVTGESINDCEKALDTCLESFLLGQDVRLIQDVIPRLEEMMPKTPAARAAVDMALYDLMSKYLNLPLAEMLGRVYKKLPTSVTIGIMPTEDALEQAEELLSRGFRVLKVKIGRSIEEDIERLYKIRENVGSRILIRVDANQGYTVDEYKEFVDHTQLLNLEFIEQPLKADDIKAMKDMPKTVREKTAADESLLSTKNALKLAHPPKPFGIFNVKLMKCGGIYSAMQIAEIAQLANIDLMWGCMDESTVSISAALHAALASPATKYIDLDGSLNLVNDLVGGGFEIHDGELIITDKPGLGVELK
jgi:L-alanine-DL-glutamate epimerase-like enolase superfamily enzyme